MRYFESVEELVMDHSFRQWVLHQDPLAAEAWAHYVARHPEQQPLIEDARRFLSTLPRTTYPMSDDQFAATWQRIVADLASHQSSAHTTVRTRSRSLAYRQWYYWAASLAALALAVAFWFYQEQAAPLSYQTAYGETKQWVLPDSSVITLNANSTLTYHPDDFSEHRVVQVEGEAYFAIQKQLNPQGNRTLFTVRTEALSIEVLGTEFNVNTRRARTQVVLAEGEVKVQLPALTTENIVYMNPGDMVTYAPEKKALRKTLVNPATRTAWRQHMLVFENTPVREIIHLLEDTYGLRIILKNQAVASRRYTGTFREPEPNTVLLALKTLFDLDMNRRDDVIILQ